MSLLNCSRDSQQPDLLGGEIQWLGLKWYQLTSSENTPLWNYQLTEQKSPMVPPFPPSHYKIWAIWLVPKQPSKTTVWGYGKTVSHSSTCLKEKDSTSSSLTHSFTRPSFSDCPQCTKHWGARCLAGFLADTSLAIPRKFLLTLTLLILDSSYEIITFCVYAIWMSQLNNLIP